MKSPAILRGPDGLTGYRMNGDADATTPHAPRPDEAACEDVKVEDFRIGFFVHDVSRVRRTLFDQKMKPLGITRSQWWVLAQLSRTLGHDGGQGVLQTELANMLDVGKVTVGGLIDRLEAGGFVERRPDARDRRAKRVVITETGHGVLQTMSSIGRDLNLRILAGVPIEHVRIAEQVLSRMKDNILEALDGEGAADGIGADPLH